MTERKGCFGTYSKHFFTCRNCWVKALCIEAKQKDVKEMKKEAV